MPARPRAALKPGRSRVDAAGRLLAPRRTAGDNPGMDILLNGEPRQLAASTTITALLEAEGLAGRRVAVEVNGAIVPRGQHSEHQLAEGDKVEIVHALGGG